MKALHPWDHQEDLNCHTQPVHIIEFSQSSIGDHVTYHMLSKEDHMTYHMIIVEDHVTYHMIIVEDHVTYHVMSHDFQLTFTPPSGYSRNCTPSTASPWLETLPCVLRKMHCHIQDSTL